MSGKFIYLVNECDDEYEWDTLGHFDTLESAKSFIASRTLPEFEEVSEGEKWECHAQFRYFNILRKELL